MKKPNLTVNELLALMGPTQRIRIFNKKQEEVYEGCRVHLQRQELEEREREVKFMSFKTEFRKKDENGNKGNEVLEEQVISNYVLKDIAIRNCVEIYTY